MQARMPPRQKSLIMRIVLLHRRRCALMSCIGSGGNDPTSSVRIDTMCCASSRVCKEAVTWIRFFDAA